MNASQRYAVKITALTVLFILFCFLSCSFAMMLGMSTRKLSIESELVIKGTVVEVVSQWDSDRSSIFSTAKIQVEEVVTGSCGKDIVEVVYDGGVVGGIGMKVSDAPSFITGETVIVFLSPDLKLRKAEAFRVYGRAQGKYQVGNDHIARKRGFSIADKEEVVENDLSADELIKKIREYKNEL